MIPDCRICPGCLGISGAARHDSNLPSFVLRHPGGNQGPRLFSGFHDDHDMTKAGDNPISAWKVMGARSLPGFEFGQQGAASPDFLGKFSVAPRIDTVDPRAHHGNGMSAGIESTLVRRRIDTDSQSTHDGYTSRRQIIAPFPGKGSATLGGAS